MTEPAAAGHSGVDASSFSLTRKLGPLPVWGWCAIAIIGVLAYRHFRPASSADSSTDNAVAPEVTVAPGGATGSPPDNASVPSYTNIPSNVQPTPETNAEWKAQALAQLSSLNSWGAYQINNALSAYLGGAQLDPTQQPIVSQALKMVGPPPQPISTPPNAGNNATATTIGINIANPIATKNGQLMHINVTWRESATGTGVTGTLLVQSSSAGTSNQWVDYSSVVVRNGVGRWDHPTAAPGIRILRMTTTRGDTAHTGISNTVSFNLK